MVLSSKLWAKVVVIGFLILLVLGFTVPGFINPTSPTGQEPVPQRMCRTDAECYLLCDGKPTNVLCSQNLCQQNSCEEYSPYPWKESGMEITLRILVEDKTIQITNLTEERNTYVSVEEGDQVRLFSDNLVLRHVLEKMDVKLTPECLLIEGNQWCVDATHD